MFRAGRRNLTPKLLRSKTFLLSSIRIV